MWTDLRAVASQKQRQGDCNHSKKVLKPFAITALITLLLIHSSANPIFKIR